MEHELFQSKLKHSVNGTLVTDMIRSTSSGPYWYRAEAVGLIIKRSIDERRKRMSTKARNSSQRDSTPRPKSEASNTPTPQTQTHTPATTSQPPSRSRPNETAGVVANPASASTTREAAKNSSAPSKPAKMIKKVARREEPPPPDVKTKPSPSEDLVELVCRKCGVRQLQSCLRSDLYCGPCSCAGNWYKMRCAGCGATKVENADACTDCDREFK
jgi:hypothetical protein